MNGICAEARSQNSRKRATRRSGGLPAISVALMAPIETPEIQSGAAPAYRDVIHWLRVYRSGTEIHPDGAAVAGPL